MPHKVRKEYDKKYSRTYYLKNKKQVIESVRLCKQAIQAAVRALKNAPCMDCGKTFHFSAMDFDHRPGESKRCALSDVSQHGSLKRALAEIEKCDLVCANCHRFRTWKRNQ